MSTSNGSPGVAAGGHAWVLGAGAASFLVLQREGWRVTLLDRAAPGDACSLGNAGTIGVGSVVWDACGCGRRCGP